MVVSHPVRLYTAGSTAHRVDVDYHIANAGAHVEWYLPPQLLPTTLLSCAGENRACDARVKLSQLCHWT